ncbi:Crp/Fnr family transcriptional regulator [Deinococcus sonorensis]|uniref:Crp/Fnr family transcriptional regulator n=1 Tax=Deinococcus sonorensis TaxID=309891 RepID=A0ABV8Y989_9DEIO
MVPSSDALLAALRQSPLFRDVPEAAHTALLEASQRQYMPDEVLIQQDAPGEALLILLSGVARISRESLGGRERVLGYVYSPAVLGETALLGSQERSATVVATEPVSALVLFRDQFERVVARHPRVLWNLARLLADRVTQQNDELIALGVSTEANIAQAFLQLYRQRLTAGTPQPERLPMTMHDLTQRVSSSRETANRLVRKLSKQQLIRTLPDHSGIELLDVEALEHLLFDLADD